MKSINSGEYRPWVESLMKRLGVQPVQRDSTATLRKLKRETIGMPLVFAVLLMVLACLGIGLVQFIFWSFDWNGFEVRIVLAAGAIGAIIGVITERCDW